MDIGQHEGLNAQRVERRAQPKQLLIKQWGSQVRAALVAIYVQLFAGSNPHVERCPNPLPWDHLVSLKPDILGSIIV